MSFSSNGLPRLNAGHEIPLEQQGLASDTTQQARNRSLHFSTKLPIEAIEDMSDQVSRL